MEISSTPASPAASSALAAKLPFIQTNFLLNVQKILEILETSLST